ncbi:molybdopterin synthase sulfur carrier subunit [Salirhabdus euzebyi]|uniref:Molybdopterin synthase sulfur carrier subunit n=1 Tax=Salirhabdus euzebyi TaxID=394506 RepID=A0A841Q6A0_9BACI|nr:molybdopterin converting factor subunit 1 [Salirhabdus euzebyi]MBB6454039.1 molybdopterin synthase sulfur carrier subunit [Salirhabdus euzebyi]
MIKILLFAHLQEELGKDKLEVELDSISVGELKTKLKDTYSLTQLDQVMVAINEEYAINEDVIKSGDVVALIPPVSGG